MTPCTPKALDDDGFCRVCGCYPPEHPHHPDCPVHREALLAAEVAELRDRLDALARALYGSCAAPTPAQLDAVSRAGGAWLVRPARGGVRLVAGREAAQLAALVGDEAPARWWPVNPDGVGYL